jgi:hypothetical protein
LSLNLSIPSSPKLTFSPQSEELSKDEPNHASSRYFSPSLLQQPLNSPNSFQDITGGKGPATALHITDIPKVTPSNGEALVKIKAFGLNRMDLLQRNGQYPVPLQAPKTLGVEFSGTIESLGEGCKDGFKVGDEVFGLA